jgi:hypothetical protein
MGGGIGLKLFDRYDIFARILPGILVIFPVLVAVLLHFPWMMPSSFARATLMAAVVAAVLWAVGAWARGYGRRTQQRLVEKWGGQQTDLMLRHGDPRIEVATKERYHIALRALVPDRALPTAEEEARDPAAALLAYRSAVRRLLENRRDARDHLVLAENISYGFWRNLHGLRLPGLFMALASATWQTLPDVLAAVGGAAFFSPSMTPALASAVGMIGWGVGLWIIADERRVRDAAAAYAERLLGTLDRTSEGSSSSAGKTARKTPPKNARPSS